MSALATLFAPAEDGRRALSPYWCEARDGDPNGLALFRRHYSCERSHRHRRGGNYAKFCGPSEHIVLIAPAGDALFVWRKERFRLDSQQGVNCSVFRNEGSVLSSLLIQDACRLAWERWTGERLFTFVNPAKIRSSNPGCCFLKARWRRCGESKSGLLILEVLPS